MSAAAELLEAAQEILEHVGAERLARNYNLTSMEIPGDMLRRLALAVKQAEPSPIAPVLSTE